mgnify:CR=1 FL=1
MNEKIEFTKKEAIYENLILALLDEFDYIRNALRKSRYEKHKTRLWNNLFRCAGTLKTLLECRPEESDMDEWLRIIQEKAPKKFAKQVYSFIKFSGKVMRDEEVSKRRGLKDS